MTKEYNKQDPEQEKKQNCSNLPSPDSADEKITYVPAENIHAIERVIRNWEEVKYEWNKLKKLSILCFALYFHVFL